MKTIIFVVIILPYLAVCQVNIGEKRTNVRDFCITKDGSRIFLPMHNKIEIWNLETNSLEQKLMTGGQSELVAVDLDSSGVRVVASGRDSTIHFWNLLDGEHRVFSDELNALVTQIRFSPNDSLVAFIRSDKVIEVWDGEAQNFKYRISPHSNDVTGIEFLDDRRLLSCSGDGTVAISDVVKQTVLSRWAASSNWLRDISVNRNKSKIAVCGDNGKTLIWNIKDAANAKLLSQDRIHLEWVTSCEFYDDNSYVVSGHDREINIISPLIRYSYKINSHVNKVMVIPNRTFLTVLAATEQLGLLVISAEDMHVTRKK